MSVGYEKKFKIDKFRFLTKILIIIILVFLIFQGYTFYQLKVENNKLLKLKSEYETILSDISEYKLLKGQYEVTMSEATDLSKDKEVLEKKISSLEKEIDNLEKRIKDINNKIKKLS